MLSTLLSRCYCLPRPQIATRFTCMTDCLGTKGGACLQIALIIRKRFPFEYDLITRPARAGRVPLARLTILNRFAVLFRSFNVRENRIIYCFGRRGFTPVCTIQWRGKAIAQPHASVITNKWRWHIILFGNQLTEDAVSRFGVFLFVFSPIKGRFNYTMPRTADLLRPL